MARDFRAEAIARKHQDRELASAQARYEIRPQPYQFATKPEGMDDSEWIRECEARWLIMALKTRDQRQHYLALVEKARGKEGRTQLEIRGKQLWDNRG